jgi:aryl-alcohol dehydrogenase-like predicted oxidoreductase
MRLSKVGDAASAAKLIRQAVALGVTSFHCSSEYETFPLFAAAWRCAGRSNTDGAAVVAKLASPHFGENRFSAAQFRAKIDFYLSSLSIERLDVVQWLLRHDLKREEERLAILHEQAQEIADTVVALKREGKIGACVGFPYTAPIAEALIGTDYCDGLALYVNPLEREMEPFLAAAAEAGKSALAIRPFAAGRLFSETAINAAQALDHAFSFAAVATVVVSASTAEHLGALARHAPAA